MTAIEHSIIATLCLAAFYYFGKYQGQKFKVEGVIEATLDMLEKNNYIKVKVDKKNGEKELIPLDK